VQRLYIRVCFGLERYIRVFGAAAENHGSEAFMGFLISSIGYRG
jgi:hypothetical protein